MTSSAVLRYDGFWKSDYDLPIVIHSNFLSVMHGLRDNEILLQAEYDVIVSLRQGAQHALFMTDSEGAAMTSW